MPRQSCIKWKTNEHISPFGEEIENEQRKIHVIIRRVWFLAALADLYLPAVGVFIATVEFWTERVTLETRDTSDILSKKTKSEKDRN